MTKNIRIENADTANYKVVVEVWDKAYKEGDSDTLVRKVYLNNPCSISNDLYITNSRYLIVKED